MLQLHLVARQESDVRVWPVAALVPAVDPASGPGIGSGLAAATLDLAWKENHIAVLPARGMSIECILYRQFGNSKAQASPLLAGFSLEHRRAV